MAITYNIDSLAVKPREAYEKVTEGALGLVSHDEMDAIINTLRHGTATLCRSRWQKSRGFREVRADGNTV